MVAGTVVVQTNGVVVGVCAAIGVAVGAETVEAVIRREICVLASAITLARIDAVAGVVGVRGGGAP